MGFSSGFNVGYSINERAEKRRRDEAVRADLAALEGSMPGGSSLDRAAAAAGVLRKHGDVAGAMDLEQRAQQSEQSSARHAREKQTWAQQDEDKKKADEYEAAKKDAFSGTTYSRMQREHEAALKKYQADREAYDARVAAGDRGPKAGAAPAAPAMPVYSLGDHLADASSLMEFEGRHGRVTPQSFAQFQQSIRAAADEGYGQALRAAQSGAPVEEVAKAFNATGKMQLDPAAVVGDRMVKGPGGVPARVIEYRLPDGRVQSINVLAELDKVGKAADVYARFEREQAGARADRAEGRAVRAEGREIGKLDEAKEKDKAKTAAGVALFQQQNPNATPAEVEAVRAGVIPAVRAPSANAPAEVKLAEAYVHAGLAKTMADGLKMAATTKADSPEKMRAEIYRDALKANFGNHEQAMQTAEKAMKFLQVEAPRPAPASKPLVKDYTDADIEATAKAYNMTPAEVRRQLGLPPK